MYGRQESCETIRRERDDLRRELDDQRHEAERKSDQEYRERERQRKERERAMSPSNRLYNGEVSDFEEATRLHVMACESERDCGSMKPTPDDDDKERAVLAGITANLNESIEQASRARAIYHKITEETKARIVEALTAEGLDDWATCLESGDYSSMAI